jgi:hypothetical protein
MSAESFKPVPLDTMGGLVSIVDGADVPLGCSPDCRDVQFFPGNVRTRPGLDPIHTLDTNSSVPYLKLYKTPDLDARLLMWDTSGRMYKETGVGTKTTISSSFTADSLYTSVTLFGKEWIAESDGIQGRLLPRVYDDTNLYLVGNQPPESNPSVWDSGTAEANPTQAPVATLLGHAGNLSVGNYRYKIVLVTGDGTTAVALASPTSNTIAVANPATAGQIQLTSIPTGTAGVVAKRRIYRTLAGGAVWYYVGYINDNTTTFYFDNLADAAVDLTKPEPALNNSGGGRITEGERQVVVYFENDAGGLSAPSPAGGWEAAGNFRVWVSNIPVWPATADERPVTKRHLAFTAAEGETFYHIPDRFTIEDNVTTSIELDFSEAELTSGEDISRLFRQAVPTTGSDFQGQLGVGKYGRRLVWWGGEPPSGDFAASAVRWSAADEPEFYDELEGLQMVSENDGQAIRAGFEMNERWYWVKDNSIHSTHDDGVNEPFRWPVKLECDFVGTLAVHGVGRGEDWVVIANRAGLYYFDGGKPIKISHEIQPTWDSINWEEAERLWVTVDTRKKRVLVGAPFCTGTTVNMLLQLDYQEGILVDPLQNNGRGRKWAPWLITAAYGDSVERDDQDFRIVLGMVDDGLVHELLNSALSDNGAAINNYYRSAYVSREEGGRQVFGYFTCLARGEGSLNLTTYVQGGASTSWNAMTLASPATKDLEKMIDVQSERVSFKLGTNAVDQWFSVAKCAIWTKEHPFSKHRGTNV